ncbi:MAG: glycosyltransferase [Flavobacteriaceae bacterium]|nr:glycosyltransferase [Flavobacteriaceae bacterium]
MKLYALFFLFSILLVNSAYATLSSGYKKDNIPNYKNYVINKDVEIVKLQKQGKVVVLYSGLIDNKKRNLKELVSAFKYLPENIILVIIPSFVKIGNDLKDLENHIKELDLVNRVHFLDSRIPPKHIDTMATADIGVGFYSPTSLNNIYAAPNRLYEFVNNGTPVVLPNFPTFKALAKEFPFAVNVANPSLPEDIANIINMIITNNKIMKQSLFSFQKKEGDYNFYAEQIEKEIFN